MKPAVVYVTAIDMCIVGYLDFEHHKHATNENRVAEQPAKCTANQYRTCNMCYQIILKFLTVQICVFHSSLRYRENISSWIFHSSLICRFSSCEAIYLVFRISISRKEWMIQFLALMQKGWNTVACKIEWRHFKNQLFFIQARNISCIKHRIYFLLSFCLRHAKLHLWLQYFNKILY